MTLEPYYKRLYSKTYTMLNTMSKSVVIPSTLVANTLSVSPTLFDQYVPGELQTKDWRKAQDWYIDGKRNECELFQRKQLETMLGVECAKRTCVLIPKRMVYIP